MSWELIMLVFIPLGLNQSLQICTKSSCQPMAVCVMFFLMRFTFISIVSPLKETYVHFPPNFGQETSNEKTVKGSQQ